MITTKHKTKYMLENTKGLAAEQQTTITVQCNLQIVFPAQCRKHNFVLLWFHMKSLIKYSWRPWTNWLLNHAYQES